jgi:hypothetical protein
MAQTGPGLDPSARAQESKSLMEHTIDSDLGYDIALDTAGEMESQADAALLEEAIFLIEHDLE